MKVISYKYLSAEINHGTEEHPNVKQFFVDKIIPWSEANEELAKLEAYNGGYSADENGEPEAPPSDAERIAELEEALALLLSGVTE